METKKKSEIFKLLNSIGLNILVIIVGTIIALIFGLRTASNMPASANMGAFIPIMKAILYGFITLIAYLSFRKPLKDYSWLITLIGIIITIYSSTNI
ncbi:hypothetical protein ACFO5T_10885 [Dokdonia genika]|uniref:Uncharacterized protein n=1 Tax=Dokdonia genika TaxID=308113 RepID=A0ABV9LAK1_9FLAO